MRLLVDNRDARAIELVPFIDHGLVARGAQLLFVRVAWVIAVAAYHFIANLDPYQPLMLAFIPSQLDFVRSHAHTMSYFARKRKGVGAQPRAGGDSIRVAC